MTYYVQPRQSRKLSLVIQIVTSLIGIFFLFAWIQERDARAQEVFELHQTLAALDSECGPVIELSPPFEIGSLHL